MLFSALLVIGCVFTPPAHATDSGPTPYFTCPTECVCQPGHDTVDTSGGPAPTGPTSVVCSAARNSSRLPTVPPSFPKSSLVLTDLELTGYALSNLELVYKRIIDPAVTSVKSVVLRNAAIATIDPSHLRPISSKLIRLYLSRNKLASAAFLSALDLSALEDLDLRDNQVSSLSADSFRGLTALRTLSLDNNPLGGRLGFLRAAPGLRSLASLQVNGIGIERIDATDFAAIQSLQALGLSNNRIATLAFLTDEVSGGRATGQTAAVRGGKPFRNLITLAMTGNRLGRGEGLRAAMFAGAPRLLYLYLRNNSITTATFLQSAHLEQLRVLDLSANHLTRLPLGAFQHMCQLEFLDLQSNSLQSLDECTLTRLTALEDLRYGNNPLQCDCGLAWLRASPAGNLQATRNPVDCPSHMAKYTVTEYPVDSCPAVTCPVADHCDVLEVTRRQHLDYSEHSTLSGGQRTPSVRGAAAAGAGGVDRRVLIGVLWGGLLLLSVR